MLHKLEAFRFGATAHELLGSPTLNVGTLSSGININSVPDKAELGVDIRTVPGIDPSALRAHLSDYLAPDLAELEDLLEMAPIYTSPDVPWIQRVYQLVNPIIGERPEPKSAGYFTDACALKPAFQDAPTIILGPGEPQQAHQTDEYCLVSKIAQAVEIYTALIDDWCGIGQHREASATLDYAT
jgi:succinyl-diaminopimelate desuccinylase